MKTVALEEKNLVWVSEWWIFVSNLMYTFCVLFILFLPLWICIRIRIKNTDPIWIRIHNTGMIRWTQSFIYLSFLVLYRSLLLVKPFLQCHHTIVFLAVPWWRLSEGSLQVHRESGRVHQEGVWHLRRCDEGRWADPGQN